VCRRSYSAVYTINAPDDVTLGGAYHGGGTSPVYRFTWSRDLLQLQQQRRRRLFVLKAEVAARFAQLGSQGVFVEIETSWRKGRRERVSAIRCSGRSSMLLKQIRRCVIVFLPQSGINGHRKVA